MKPLINVLSNRRLSLLAGALIGASMLGGCMMDPPGPSPVYSRLPSAQTQPAQPLSKDEQERYNQIDAQALADQQHAMAADAAAQAWSQYYRPPVSVYGSYYGGGGGWGHGWGSGVGIGYSTGYAW